MSRRPRSPGFLLIAALSLVVGAGCPSSRESPASSIQRDGARGPHRFRLRSEIRPARLTLGDPATWKLSAELPREARARSVMRDSAGPWMDVTAVREPAPGEAPAARGGTWELEYRVRAFDLGRIPLPRTAIVVAWPDPRPAGVPQADTLEFPPDTVTVDSLTTPETAALEPDRGPVRPGLRVVDIALVAAGALLLVAAIVVLALLWRARRRRAAAVGPAAPPEPPEAPFRRTVEALRQDVETLPRDVFYERLSLAVRTYLTAVTGVPALDRTTTEIEREFARDGRFGPEALRALARTLDRSDLAKFARHEDQLAEARSALEEASSLPGHFSAPAPASQQAAPPAREP